MRKESISDNNQSSSSKKQSCQKTDKTKYKTEMCKNWIEVGYCRYGSKCQFAHGDQELMGKQAPSNSKYKSKQCTTFQEKLFCPYGKRCLFRHEDRTIDEIKELHFTILLQFFPQKLVSKLKTSDSEAD